jgi:hypothetical protein
MSLSIIESLKAQGHSQSDIARMTGYTRQYISWIVNTYGGSLTERQQVMREHWPFIVPAHMNDATQNKLLRNHGEYVVTGGKGMSANKIDRLRSFYKKLRDENLVVEFDPTIPPDRSRDRAGKMGSMTGGWRYVERVPEDGELLIRVNEYTHLTDEGEEIWRFPDREL